MIWLNSYTKDKKLIMQAHSILVTRVMALRYKQAIDIKKSKVKFNISLYRFLNPLSWLTK